MIRMPEAAEVKKTVDYLNSVLKDRLITEWIFYSGKYSEEDPDGYIEFCNALPLKVDSVNCKGKFIYFTLQGGWYILHSLMMTGKWQRKYDEQCKWCIETKEKSDIWFRNPRGLATVKFTNDKKILDKKLSALGPSIMTDEFSLNIFRDKAKMFLNRNITSFLMDQSIFSGCGNYIKAEALYRVKISPLRKVATLSETEQELLWNALKNIPLEAYNGKLIRKIYGKKNAFRIRTADGRITHCNLDLQH
jgi:formamidopyrimidine-DNA glycosylase